MKTIIDRYPEAAVRLSQMGRPNIVEMARFFNDNTEMGQALGISRSGLGKWFNLTSLPQKSTEKKAAEWLLANGKVNLEADPSGMLKPESKPKSGKVYMVSMGEDSDKLERILTMLGCEFVEI